MSTTSIRGANAGSGPSSGDDDSAAVRVEGLVKGYRGWGRRRAPALDDCGFALPTGSVTALIGANGAGKTTLLSVLAGLLEPEAGRVEVVGRTAFLAEEKPVYRQLSPVRMFALAAQLNVVFDHDRARSWLERFDVPTDRACGRLSGGQRTHVALAMALGARPDVLLLDEPLAELDPVARREATRGLLAHASETGTTVVLSTHVVAELGGVADRLLLLHGGRIVLAGDIDDLVTRHVHYIGPRADAPPGPGGVIAATHHGHQSRFLACLPEDAGPPAVDEPWTTSAATLDDLVQAYLTRDATPTRP